MKRLGCSGMVSWYFLDVESCTPFRFFPQHISICYIERLLNWDSGVKLREEFHTHFTASKYKQLELRQRKNEFVSVKRMLVLKLPPFSPFHVGEGKRVAILKQTCFPQKRVRS